MSETNSTERLSGLLGDLQGAIAARQAAEGELAVKYAQGTGDNERELERSIHELDDRHQAEVQAARAEYESTRGGIIARCEDEYSATQNEYQATLRSAAERSVSDEEAARRDAEEAQWMIASVLDDNSIDSPKQRFEQFQSDLQRYKERMQAEREKLDDDFRSIYELLVQRRQWVEFEPPEETNLPKERRELQDAFEEHIAAVHGQIAALRAQRLAALFSGIKPALVFLAIGLPISALLYFLVDPGLFGLANRTDPAWMAITGGAAVGISLLWVGLMFVIARNQSGNVIPDLLQDVADARAVHDRWQKLAKQELARRRAEYERTQAAIESQREKSLAQIQAKEARRLAEIDERKRTTRTAAERTFPEQLKQLVAERDQQLALLDANYQRERDVAVQLYQRERGRLEQEISRVRSERGLYRQREWQTLAENWNLAVAGFLSQTQSVRQEIEQATMPWNDILAEGWRLPGEIPSAVRFGRFNVDLGRIEGAIPQDEPLHPPQTRIEFPAWLPFPQQASLLLEAHGEGRGQAVEALKTVMLRLLTSLPAGKVRLTIIDPLGLGENFSAFMHLADFDDQLINTRIWTESSHIDKRLAELSEHMENVFQAYLRNEYASIEEYNRHAGEVAEPYHILVVANFPANFSEGAARRLVSIASNGARCGVYTLVSVDTKQVLPHSFDLADLEAHALTLRWSRGNFYGAQPELVQAPIVLDAPPDPDAFNRIVRAVGRQSQDSRRVEVPFERITPHGGQMWTSDSRGGIDVPVGRAGATKLQSLRLGKGTSQHVLVAGKTGSGKSSLLHALVTNLVLYYSPREVEFYLIDFKKGVEFKTYAVHGLPHARAIAIESDREFGVSVLERLDEIMKERGELFRASAVQDLPSYRNAHPDAVLPRILLIVDEFQEFFVEDDALAQSATLLLDRLVRQGRAFGIHVLLGSQTLGGAYTLARSTLGQVAVRIALQCSETDAHLILSEENSAARLLSRPGEAIYNDANGLVEGNHPFQVAWLPDDRREACLIAVRERTEQEGIDMPAPIVFEGNVASDASRNRGLVGLIEAFGSAPREVQTPPPAELRAWLGEAVAIKPPTQLVFRRRSGTNLLIVGSQVESAQGILATSMLALATQLPRERAADDGNAAKFFVLDGDALAAGESKRWRKLSDVLPQDVEIAGQREAAATIQTIAAEVTRRSEDDSAAAWPWFLIVSNLGQFRDLKKAEDEFGFGGEEGGATSAGQQLEAILKNGPALGVYTLVWCDTFPNANRWLSHAALREFEMRVAMQMNGTDSSNLIESPAAAKLGVHRAFLYHADRGTLEKFRPYGAPSAEWLAAVERQMRPEPEPEIVEKLEDIDSWTIN